MGLCQGQRHCFHNYWNYNRTYGNLLDQHEQRKAQSKKGNSPERNQIDVIRSEHAVDDWNNIDKLLGGTAMTGTFDETRNNFTDSIAHGPNKTYHWTVDKICAGNCVMKSNFTNGC